MKTNISPLWSKLLIKDEISLISQLYDGFSTNDCQVLIVLIKNKEDQRAIELENDKCGVEDIKTINVFIEAKVFDFLLPEEKNLSKNNNRDDPFLVSINWQNLHSFASIYHDKEAVARYGIIKQLKIMRKIISDKAEKLNSTKFKLTEKDLGEYMVIPTSEDELSHIKSPDRNIQFMQTLFTLEQNKFIKILGFDFDFAAEPEQSRTEENDNKLQSVTADQFYYPAEHCHVIIEFLGDEKKEQETIPITKNWFFVENGYVACIYNGNKNLFTFYRLNKNPYLYFKYLCINYGKKISYEEMYKTGNEIKDRTHIERWEENASVRRTINKLKQKFKNKRIKQIKINTKKYLELTISS